MRPVFRSYDHSYYDLICDFLIELSEEDRKHINWNWARWGCGVCQDSCRKNFIKYPVTFVSS